VHDIIRRCGGGSSCAGFNSKENSLFDKSKQEKDKQLLLNQKKDRLAKCGRYIYEQFRKVVLEDKKKN
jgi:hypothetical protein